MSLWAIFPAAGRGSRVGSELPKQYRVLAGRPMIEHAITPFLELPDIAGLLVALAPDDAHWSRTALAREPRIETVVGGDERRLSVLAALRKLAGRAMESDWVLVHDVARPCVGRALPGRLVDTLRDHPVGGLLAVPVADTLKSSVEGEYVETTVPRAGLWRAQTPQMFRHGQLLEALERSIVAGEAVTDESAAIENLGLRPRLVAGAESNIKVTREEDFAIAACHLLGAC